MVAKAAWRLDSLDRRKKDTNKNTNKLQFVGQAIVSIDRGGPPASSKSEIFQGLSSTPASTASTALPERFGRRRGSFASDCKSTSVRGVLCVVLARESCC
jgi:hypothetical protein